MIVYQDFISVTEDSILDSAGKYEITKINIYTSAVWWVSPSKLTQSW